MRQPWNPQPMPTLHERFTVALRDVYDVNEIRARRHEPASQKPQHVFDVVMDGLPIRMITSVDQLNEQLMLHCSFSTPNREVTELEALKMLELVSGQSLGGSSAISVTTRGVVLHLMFPLNVVVRQ